jgi:predicted  nucleic acid-binding Zn-ribbon protein
MSEDSAELNVDSDDEGFKTKKTVGFKTAAGQHFEKDDLGKSLEDMDKEDLIDLIISGGQKELRNTNFGMALLRERMSHFERAIKELEESIAIKRKKADKFRAISGDKERSIKAIERIIENNKKKIEELSKKVKEFEDKKKKKAVEQINAKKEITKKLVNGLYKYFEKDSDPILIRLTEAFVACLRNSPSANKEDVEIYFRKYDGLMCSMNKLDTKLISGGNAKIYSDTVQAIRNEFKGDTKYAKYIPFLVFLNQTCSIVSLSVEERQIEKEIEELEEDIKQKEKEIDEIETYHKHVDEPIDYDALVQQEEEQLKLLTNHYLILE